MWHRHQDFTASDEDKVTASEVRNAVIGVLKTVLPPRKAEKLACELGKTVAKTYPQRPKIEGDAIQDRGTEKDPLYRLIAATLTVIPDSPRPPDYATRYYATLASYDAIANLYSESPQQSYSRY